MIGRVYTGISLLPLSARGTGEIPGPGTEHHGTSTPTYDGPSNDILLARLVTPHLPSLSLSVSLRHSFSRLAAPLRLSFALSSHTGCPMKRKSVILC